MDQTTRRTAFRLRFAEFGDLAVRVRKPSFRGGQLLTDAVRVLGPDLRGEHLAADVRLDAWAHVLDAFAAALIDWNLTDQGVAVPATRDGVYEQDAEFLIRIASVWYQRVVLRRDRPAGAEPAPAQKPASEPPASEAPEPSAEELALASIPVEVGNAALGEGTDQHAETDAEDDGAVPFESPEPEQAPESAEVPAPVEAAESS